MGTQHNNNRWSKSDWDSLTQIIALVLPFSLFLVPVILTFCSFQ